MFTPAFAFLTDTKEAITEFVNNCLLVAGGFLIGYILGGVIGWAFGKWVMRQQAPQSPQRIGRPVGGVILALIVALIVFTGRGKPHGEGGDGKGNVSQDANKNSSNPPEQKVPVIINVPKNEANSTIFITAIGGDAVKEGRFYLIDDDRTPKNFEEATKAITERAEKAKGKVELKIVLLPPPNDLALSHEAILRLQRWAFDKGFGSPAVVKGTGE